MKFKVRVDDQEREIEVVRQGDRLRIINNDQATEVRILHTDGAHFVLEYEQPAGEHTQRRQIRAAGYLEGDERQLWVNGSMVHYDRIREQGMAPGAAAAASLTASIPAVVSEILVTEGDYVAAGEKLILLESMKMILPIQAPYDGVVSRIHCSQGEAVQPGVPLIELEEDET